MNGCAICGDTNTFTVVTVRGRHAQRDFTLKRCPTCRFVFVANPWTDYAKIYDDRYYAGQGADHLANYTRELEAPERSIRWYEWEGITTVIAALTRRSGGLRWLDYGCGTGGLVRHANRVGHQAVGYEPSVFGERLPSHGIPTVADLAPLRGQFDVVTAIEVIEHTTDPVAELTAMRKLLRPGGLSFLTTGNAEPYRDRLATWRYVIPEIHVSYFEPETLEEAMRRAGLRPQRAGYVAGFDQILKFKVLKNLHSKNRSFLTDLIPAVPVARLGERIARVSEQPVGWA